jgi:hypothetical protein
MGTPPTPQPAKRPVEHEDITHLLGKALVDPHFRHRLLSDPAKVLDELGYAQGPKTIKFFKDLGGPTGAFDKAARDLQIDGIGRAGDC